MSGSNAARDVRLSGFGDRAPLSTAWAWLDAWSVPSSPEIVPLAEATGRVLAESITASIDPPDPPRAAENGYAVRSADCDGADAYNPLLLSLGDAARFACILQQCLLPYPKKC
jgi:molybdopterin molybdotransferase